MPPARTEKKWDDPHAIGQNYTSGFERIPMATDENLALLFHENTKSHQLETLPTRRRAEPWYPNRGMEIVVSKHLMPPDSDRVVRLPTIDLASEPTPPLGRLVAQRRSQRRFTPDSISLHDLSLLLSFAYGVTGRQSTPHGDMYLHAVPSGGARYPLEVYAVVRAVSGLAPGVYHYRPEPHYLEFLRGGDFSQDVDAATRRQGFAQDAATTLIISAMWHRNMDKYGERGYRGVLMEAGAVIQNLYLAAESLSLGAVAVEGVDEAWNNLIDVDGSDETTLVAVSVGRPHSRPKEHPTWP